MKLFIYRLLIGVLIVIGCLFISILLPAPFINTSGRNFLPYAILFAVLITFGSALLRGKFNWRFADFLGIIILAEITTLLVIQNFSGSEDIFGSFNMVWLRDMNLFIGLPWITGFLIGNQIIKRTSIENSSSKAD